MTAEIILVSAPSSLELDKRTAQRVATTLVNNQISVREQISVCTDRVSLQQSISKAIARCELIVTIGGMGGAAGFLCKQVMSEGLRLPLVHSAETLQSIQEFARANRVPYYPEDATYASLPQASRPLLPRYGKQPGCVITSTKQSVIMLPESLEEALSMLTEQAIPRLPRATAGGRSVHSIRTYGISEPQVRRMLVDLLGTNNPSISIRPQGEELALKVTAQAADSAAAAALTAPVLQTIATRLGDYAYGLNVESLESALVQKMHRKQLTLSVAEAGTTGLFYQVLAGLEHGKTIVSYHGMPESNDTKTRQLGIPAKMLRRQGDVSEYTAVAMAHGALIKGKSTIGVGICADIPGEAQKENAEVFIAVCSDKDVYIKKLVVHETGSRSTEAVMQAAVARALNMARLFVDYYPEKYQGSVPLDYALSTKENITDQESYNTDEGQSFPSHPLDTPVMPKPPKEKKRKKKKGKLRRVFALLVLLTFLASGGYFGLHFYRSTQALTLRDDLAALYQSSKFIGLKAHNKDVVAYISIDDTAINYPIVQTTDNEFYYRRNFYKEDDNHGIPYMDKNVTVLSPSTNMVVYGHNMADGQLFGELLKYAKLDFYQQHPVINFDTVSHLDLEREGQYKIISVFITNTYKKHGEIFNYHKWIDLDAEEFSTYVAQVKLRSLLNTTVDTQVGDELITLSTCDYNFSGSRFVVVARRVRFGESPTVDVDGARYNPEPLLPDVWYKSFGGSPPNQKKIDAAGGVTGENSFDISGRVTAGLAPGAVSVSSRPPITPVVVEQTTPAPSKDVGEQYAEDLLFFLHNTLLSSEEEVPESSSSSSVPSSVAPASSSSSQSESSVASTPSSSTPASSSSPDATALAAQKAEQEEKEKAEKDRLALLAVQQKKQEQESKAIAAEKIAQIESDNSLSAQRSTLNSESYKEAISHAETAQSSALKSESAATEATVASQGAGSDRALTAASNAQNYARVARTAADTAGENANAMKPEPEAESGSSGSSSSESSSSGSSSSGSSGSGGNAGNSDYGTVRVNGVEGDALDFISRIVQNEVGSSFHEEAIKAQAVAAYTFIKHANNSGSSASAVLSSTADSKVIRLVEQVLGEAVYYNGALAFTPYHATSSGHTTTSASVWGGSYPYLVSVDSSVDENARNYEVTKTMRSSEVASILSSKLGIDTEGDPAEWFEVLGYVSGNYVERMRICGETKSQKTGNTLSGRLVRESVFSLRSAAFTIEYDYSSDEFTFTTYGYGHGVGMSQTGANFYAQQGWSYQEILEHYYTGTSVR